MRARMLFRAPQKTGAYIQIGKLQKRKLEARGRRSKASRIAPDVITSYIVGKACSDYMCWEKGCYAHTLR